MREILYWALIISLMIIGGALGALMVIWWGLQVLGLIFGFVILYIIFKIFT